MPSPNAVPIAPSHRVWVSARRAPFVRCLGALVILLAGWYAFAPALHGDWVWDDEAEIVQNALIKDPAGLGKIWRGEVLPDYFPLKSTVQWVQWHLWGNATAGYHVTNLGLHLLSALLVWRLLCRLGLRCGWLGGLLFALHPLTVESVAWIAELKNVLSLPPLLLAFDRFMAFTERGRRRDYAWAVGLFAAAMLCKTSVVALPVFLFVYLAWHRGRLERRDFRTVLPFLIIAVVLGAVTVWFQSTRAIGDLTIPSGGALERVGRAGLALGFYFGKCLVPIGLRPLYPRDILADSPWLGLLAWLAVALVFLGCWRRRATWGRHAILGLAWFVLNVGPVLGLINMSYLHFAWVADHFAYVSLVGLIGLVVAGAEMSWRHSRMGRGMVAGGAAVLAVAAVGQTRQHAALYQGDATLWRHILRQDPGSWIAHNNLATTLIRQRNLSEALHHADIAVRLRPVYPAGHFTRAAALINLGRLDEAKAEAALLVSEGPFVAELHLKLAAALLRANRVAEAIAHYEQTLRAKPDWAQAYKEFAVALFFAGRSVEALDYYDRGLQLAPDPETHSNYGVALAGAGRVNEAMQQYERSLRLKPGYPEAHYNYGIALAASGRPEEAKAHYEAALKAQPERAELHYNLGRALLQLGRRAPAEAAFVEALRLNPALAEARQQLEALRQGANPP